MKVILFTQARIRDLEFGSGIWRDTEVKGLLVICHRTVKTYAVQGDLRRHGSHIRTVRLTIDRCDRIALREARERARELMGRIKSGIDPAATGNDTGMTLGRVFERYVEERTLSPATLESYTYHLRHYLKAWKDRAVADITRADMRELFDALKLRSGITTAGLVMRTLRALINEARRFDETLPANPVASLRLPQAKSRDVPALDLPGWWKKVQDVPPVRRDLHIFLLFTGLRRRSAANIRRDDVDLQGGTVCVRHMKSRKPFILPLSGFLTELLQRRMEEDRLLGSEWLWPSRTSRSGHIEEPGLREYRLPSPHACRHLWRTHAIAAGVPYAESALLLDHRLPGASGGYVHAEHLAGHLRQYQQAVTDRLLSLIGLRSSAESVGCYPDYQF